MSRTIVIAALCAALVGPASASTVLDFTSGAIGTGNLSGQAAGTSYSISGSGKLTNSMHKTNAGCTLAGWNFACSKTGTKYDVGLGVAGTNGNEIDPTEWVQVKFDSLVRVLGFAGMLGYNDSTSPGTETVILQYSANGGSTWGSVFASALDDDNNNQFSTVGLAFIRDLSITANVVRFTASGKKPYDDGNANVTAAGLKIAAVPVPASLPLLIAGIGALVIAGRRKGRMAT